MANHLLNVCHYSTSKFEYFHAPLLEGFSVQNNDDNGKVLWEREKHWQGQLNTLCLGINNPNKWYVLNRRSYRKIILSISQENFIESDIGIDTFLLVSITLFCDQGC